MTNEAKRNENTAEPLVRLSDEPRNLTEWLWRLKRYERGIYVREQVDGRWGNVALADLTPERWAHYVARWLENGALPCRIREPEEMQPNAHTDLSAASADKVRHVVGNSGGEQ